jgi:hypothetical protein
VSFRFHPKTLSPRQSPHRHSAPVSSVIASTLASSYHRPMEVKVIFHRRALADENCLIFIGFSPSRRKLFGSMKISIFLVVLSATHDSPPPPHRTHHTEVLDPLPFQHNRMKYLIICTLEVIHIKYDCFDKFFRNIALIS